MEKYITKLKMLPVCNCGHIFRDGIVVYKKILKTNGIKYPEYSIEPNMCPNCKKKIECIEHYHYMVEEIERF